MGKTVAPLGSEVSQRLRGAAPSSHCESLGYYSTPKKAPRTEEAGTRGMPPLLLWLGLLLCTLGFQAGGEEEQQCLLEGKNLTVTCPYNIMLYRFSLKAWQRVRHLGSPENLVLTSSRNGNFSLTQAGRYFLEDDPTEAVVKVTVTGLQRQDVGLYQCVIYLSPDNVIILFHRIWLVQCQNQPVMVIVLTCGFILNKSLVFSVLLVLLCKTEPKVSQPPNVSEAPGVSEKQ